MAVNQLHGTELERSSLQDSLCYTPAGGGHTKQPDWQWVSGGTSHPHRVTRGGLLGNSLLLMVLTCPPIPHTWIQSSTVGHRGVVAVGSHHRRSRSWLMRWARSGRSIPSVLSSGPRTDAVVFSYRDREMRNCRKREKSIHPHPDTWLCVCVCCVFGAGLNRKLFLHKTSISYSE